MPDLLYPTTSELITINQLLLPNLESNRVPLNPANGMFPIRSVDQHWLEWEQRDNYTGLQQARGLNGKPSMVRPIGGQRYQIQPGVYGEFEVVDEQELTTRRPWGQWAGPIDISDLVREKQDHLLQRRLDRIEKICWDLMLAGTYQVLGPNGAILHVDSFTTQTFAAGTPWSTLATSTPFADIRQVQLKSRGYSVSFGAGAKMWMNRTTAINLLSNQNANDLGGRKTSFATITNNLSHVNELLAGDDLPQFAIYEGGYVDEANVFRLFIPNGKIVLVGARRDGDTVGEYRFTRNVNNPQFAPGAYTRVIDDPDEIPRTVVVHDGHSGGPVLYYPSAIVVLTV
jgi:hypothetical protein